MTIRKHVVVDGSNIATEGRERPSLKQLDEAVRSFLAEHPTELVTVVVDATFGHRIDESERPEYEEAVLAGELVAPPAGVIGRGDAFVLQIAGRADATILSNDSFQEFHAQYPWLFDDGRLIGGKPVHGVGWVFMLRTPVRGAMSRKVTREARSGEKGRRRGRKDREPVADKAPRKRTEKSAAPALKAAPATRNRPKEPVNEPLPFLDFVGRHPVNTMVEAEVASFSSHGAYVTIDGVRCYVPLKLMGDPMPRSARSVLSTGEVRRFVVFAIDGPSRSIDLALVADAGSRPETPADEAVSNHEPTKGRTTRARSRKHVGATEAERVNQKGEAESQVAGEEDEDANIHLASLATTSGADTHAEEAPVTPVKKTVKKAAKKSAPKRAAKKAVRKTTAKKAARKTTARKAVKRPAKKTAKRTTKKAAKRPAKKTAKRTTKKAAKRPAKKTAKRTTKKAAKRPAKKTAKRTTKKTARRR